MLPRQLQPPRPDGSLGRAQTRLFFLGPHRDAENSVHTRQPTASPPASPPSPPHQRHQRKSTNFLKELSARQQSFQQLSITVIVAHVTKIRSIPCYFIHIEPPSSSDKIHSPFLLDPAQKSVSLISSLLTAQSFHRDPVDLFFFFAHT